MLLIFNEAFPVLVRVTDFAPLVVPTTMPYHFNAVGTRLTAGPPLCPMQLSNLKLAMRVLQLKLPFALMYSCVYQNVQSSAGSMVMEL